MLCRGRAQEPLPPGRNEHIAVFRQKLPMQLVSASTKLRQIFYTQLERRTFHTAWTLTGHWRSRAKAHPFIKGIEVDRGHRRRHASASRQHPGPGRGCGAVGHVDCAIRKGDAEGWRY